MQPETLPKRNKWQLAGGRHGSTNFCSKRFEAEDPAAFAAPSIQNTTLCLKPALQSVFVSASTSPFHPPPFPNDASQRSCLLVTRRYRTDSRAEPAQGMHGLRESWRSPRRPNSWLPVPGARALGAGWFERSALADGREGPEMGWEPRRGRLWLWWLCCVAGILLHSEQ